MEKIPLLPLRDFILFPKMIAPIFVGRTNSVNAVNDVLENSVLQIVVVGQKDSNVEKPGVDDIYNFGALAKIIQYVRLPNNTIKLLVEGITTVKINPKYDENFLSCLYQKVEDVDDFYVDPNKMHILKERFTEYVRVTKGMNPELTNNFNAHENPGYLTNFVSANIIAKNSFKQTLLETSSVPKRIELINEFLEKQIGISKAENVLQQKVRQQIEKNQRDYYLTEQMKAIQKELDDGRSDISEFETKINTVGLSKEAKIKAEGELKKLKLMNPMSSEASVIRSYLDVLLNMPWGKCSTKKIDLNQAQKILDADHYGLEKIKERIVEYLAVLKRTKDLKSPILCFVGPPGVGKTSLVKSIANAVGRKYAKFALGGVRDEAEIRGHRRTYLGSMPGKIISLIKRCKTSNPVILLDEIDKISSDFRGDPAAALLEVLDPEQNAHFSDHYLEVEYDLSKVMFIATANSLNLPRPLLDRMEIIPVSGYIEDEKMEIAKKHIIPNQNKNHGLALGEMSITDDALLNIVRYYTKESGVRELEREIGKIARKSLKKILDKETKGVKIDTEDLEKFLGVKKYKFRSLEEKDLVGVTNGLAYSEVGGDLLAIEAVSIPGKGEIKATGSLGDVMKESTQTAYSYFKSQASRLGFDCKNLEQQDIHIHFPAGATPKDGPSAGVAIFTTISSLLLNVPVKKSVAMTGEISLRGTVLEIGGLREKLLAAKRGGITTVIIPQGNQKDLKEIPISVKEGLDIIPISNANEVLDIALSKREL